MAEAFPVSDSDREEPGEDEGVHKNTKFQNDICDLLKKRVNENDPLLLTFLLSEIEELRKSHKVESSVVPRVIMFCTLYLPVSLYPNLFHVERSKQNVMGNYLEKLREILCKLRELITYIRGGPGGQAAMEHFAHGVEEAIRALQRQRICVIHQHVTDLLIVIEEKLACKFYSITEAVQRGRYDTTPDDSIPSDDFPSLGELQYQPQQQQKKRLKQQVRQQQRRNRAGAGPGTSAKLGFTRPAEVVNRNANSKFVNNSSRRMADDIAYSDISSLHHSSTCQAAGETVTKHGVNMRYEVHTLVSEPTAREDEKQDGSKHIVSGFRNMARGATRDSLQSQGLSDENEILAIGISYDDNEANEPKEQNDE